MLLLETIGLWFVHNRLEVPPERLEAVKVIYHFSVLSFIATIFTSPFLAIIIAHEDMKLYAYVSIFESIMKLVIVYLLSYLAFDKLKLYSFLVMSVSIMIASIYVIICTRRYSECQFKKLYWNKKLLSEIINFTGWTLFGRVTTVMRIQAITILLNQVFNPIVVAARAIAINITSKVNIFSNNFNVGLYPPIVKSYANDNKKEMFDLIFNGSKITFFLMWVFALPFFLEMENILNLWLKNPPQQAVLFTRLALIEVLIDSISLPLTTAARAPGRMKGYELRLGSIQIAIFLSCWIFLKLDFPAYTVFWIAIVGNILMFLFRLIIVRGLIDLPVRSFLIEVFLPVIKVAFASAILSFCIHIILPENIFTLIFSIGLSIILSLISMYYLGLNSVWRAKSKNFVLQKIKKNRG